MRNTILQSLRAAALVGALSAALATLAAQAQDHLDVDRPLTLASAGASSSAGGTGAEEKDQQAELAKKLNNPVASLISVPIQNNWDFGIGPADAMRYTA